MSEQKESLCFGFDSMHSDHDIERVRRLMVRVDKAETENARLRAMLPQRLEGLPTEPGWYWVWDTLNGGEWKICSVISTGDDLWYRCGSGWGEVSRANYVAWYGPLTPPDHFRDATETMEVE